MKLSGALLSARCRKRKTKKSPCVVCHGHETAAEHVPNNEHIMNQPRNDVQLNAPNQKTLGIQECLVLKSPI